MYNDFANYNMIREMKLQLGRASQVIFNYVGLHGQWMEINSWINVVFVIHVRIVNGLSTHLYHSSWCGNFFCCICVMHYYNTDIFVRSWMIICTMEYVQQNIGQLNIIYLVIGHSFAFFRVKSAWISWIFQHDDRLNIKVADIILPVTDTLKTPWILLKVFTSVWVWSSNAVY